MAIEDWVDFAYLDEEYFGCRRDPRCNRCGKKVYWVKQDKWVLMDPKSGAPHDCSARRARASEFPDLGEE